METGFESLHGLFGVQAGRRGNHDDVGVGFGEHLRVVGVAFRAGALLGGVERDGVGVAHGDEFAVVFVCFKRAEMVVGNAAAADEGEFDFAAGDGLVFYGFEHFQTASML